MERVQEELGTIEVYENDIQMYLKMFCEENDIDNMKQESQSVWNSALHYIFKNVFKDTDKLKSNKLYKDNGNTILSNHNSYDYQIVNQVLDIYIYELCMKYDKEVSVIGFSTLTGIDRDTLYGWGNGETKLSHLSSDVFKKLRDFREESLSNKLATGKQNPVGVIAMLNRHYGWASPYTSDSNRQKSSLTAAELPKLGQNDASIRQIAQLKNDE